MFAAILYLVACAACTVLLLSLVAYFEVGKYSIDRPYWHSMQTVLKKAGRGRPNYKYVGMTKSLSGHPLGDAVNAWQIDTDRVQVGEGENAFVKGKELLTSCKHMQLEWSYLNFTDQARVGAELLLVTRVLGLAYIMSPLRIISAAESSGDHQIPGSAAHKEIRQLPCYARGVRYDTALSSLEGCVLCVEERCSLQWCKEDDTVWLELYSISKPATLDAYLAFPLLRYYQRQHREASIAAMKKALALPDEAVDKAMHMWDAMRMG